jgi:cyclin-dependent kinase 7
MSASPLVAHPTDVRSPLKNASSAHTSANGTPNIKVAGSTSNAPISLPPTLDIAEQMNEEEKRKYVKGTERNSP